MSVTYPAYTKSKFPDEIDNWMYFSDVTEDLLVYAKQYQTYYQSGNLNAAAQLLIDHPELQPCMINASNLNNIVDALKCIETFYLNDLHKYIENIISFKGNYSSSAKYSKYDLVIYNNLGYLCISFNCQIGTVPTNTSYWVALTLKGDKGTDGEDGLPGIGLSFNGAWDSTKTYNSSSAVTYNNCLYASAIDNNKGKTPSANSSYWNIIFNLKAATEYDNSVSGATPTTMQGALDDLYSKTNNNISSIGTNASSISSINSNISSLSSSINSINTKLNGIESGAEANTVTGVKGSSESSYRTGLINISPSNLGITVVNNTADSNKSVKYASSAGNANTANSATTSSSCTGNSATATKATNADHATNADSANYATTSGTANTANTATSATNATNATNANYANSSGNSDTIDGYHIQVSTTNLTVNSSSLGTNILYFVYE